MKKARLSLWIRLSIVVLTGGFAFVATSRAGYETASYEIVKKDGLFEVRDYPGMVVVSTSMTAGGQNGSFGRLFKYISGENASTQKIAMTTPVFMPASGSGDPEVMQFVVPASVAGAGTPPPTDPSVKLSKMKGGKYAVLRYNGRSSAGDRVKNWPCSGLGSSKKGCKRREDRFMPVTMRPGLRLWCVGMKCS